MDNLDKNKDNVKEGVGKVAGAVGMDKAGRAVAIFPQCSTLHTPAASKQVDAGLDAAKKGTKALGL